jgi:2-phospho-L-lactate guanylyltransferase
VRFALIPVKQLDKAKERLSSVLDPASRRELVIAMFRDVLAAAIACDALDGVAVVSRDPTVQAIARDAGATVISKPGTLNRALTLAADDLRERGVTRLLVLLADIPLATPDAIAQVLAAEADVVVVPSQDGGTNALLLKPGAIDFEFGLASAAHHLLAARSAKLRALQLNIRPLGFDVDTPRGLRQLAGRPPTEVGPATSEVLTKLLGRVNFERA